MTVPGDLVGVLASYKVHSSQTPLVHSKSLGQTAGPCKHLYWSVQNGFLCVCPTVPLKDFSSKDLSDLDGEKNLFSF